MHSVPEASDLAGALWQHRQLRRGVRGYGASVRHHHTAAKGGLSLAAARWRVAIHAVRFSNRLKSLFLSAARLSPPERALLEQLYNEALRARGAITDAQGLCLAFSAHGVVPDLTEDRAQDLLRTVSRPRRDSPVSWTQFVAIARQIKHQRLAEARPEAYGVYEVLQEEEQARQRMALSNSADQSAAPPSTPRPTWGTLVTLAEQFGISVRVHHHHRIAATTPMHNSSVPASPSLRGADSFAGVDSLTVGISFSGSFAGGDEALERALSAAHVDPSGQPLDYDTLLRTVFDSDASTTVPGRPAPESRSPKQALAAGSSRFAAQSRRAAGVSPRSGRQTAASTRRSSDGSVDGGAATLLAVPRGAASPMLSDSPDGALDGRRHPPSGSVLMNPLTPFSINLPEAPEVDPPTVTYGQEAAAIVAAHNSRTQKLRLQAAEAERSINVGPSSLAGRWRRDINRNMCHYEPAPSLPTATVTEVPTVASGARSMPEGVHQSPPSRTTALQSTAATTRNDGGGADERVVFGSAHHHLRSVAASAPEQLPVSRPYTAADVGRPHSASSLRSFPSFGATIDAAKERSESPVFRASRDGTDRSAYRSPKTAAIGLDAPLSPPALCVSRDDLPRRPRSALGQRGVPRTAVAKELSRKIASKTPTELSEQPQFILSKAQRRQMAEAAKVQQLMAATLMVGGQTRPASATRSSASDQKPRLLASTVAAASAVRVWQAKQPVGSAPSAAAGTSSVRDAAAGGRYTIRFPIHDTQPKRLPMTPPWAQR